MFMRSPPLDPGVRHTNYSREIESRKEKSIIVNILIDKNHISDLLYQSDYEIYSDRNNKKG